ncbi:hypothetical protein [Alteromonas sp. RKMC-009]|uniref:hypothetical protein n=1 Tax=Alteromonas sp. RKMC-009 TaxID=2267264 RepID=UPI0010C3C05A|nr:hypothetical protein [Alteromonas sp. RKMC-009]QBX05406.1 hypothetical protein DS731_22160 [Alteromonas sp. RKMC-009]
MAVFGIGVDGKPYSKADEMEASEPYFQWELEDLLVEKHKQIVASFNKNQMLSVGWIATPYPKSWDEREAARHLINLGALDFEQIEPGVVRSLIA